MRNALLQVLGVVLMLLPLAAIQWDLTGKRSGRRSSTLEGQGHRWRLELYSNHSDIEQAMNGVADIPFAFKRVRSARGELASQHPERAWSLPRIELEVDVEDPFSADALIGLFGPEHSVRFVSGNEAVIDPENAGRIRVKAIRHRQRK